MFERGFAMKCYSEAKSLVFPIPAGPLYLEGPVHPKHISLTEFDSGLKAFRPPHQQKKALLQIAQLEEGRVFIARLEQRVIGYVTFHKPDTFERWANGPKELIELGAIEVAPYYRQFGVAKKILEVAFMNLEMEDYLVIATEYYWHWDLDGTGLLIWEYRKVMEHLFSHIGMVIKETDEEEIISHPANMLMVRYGKNVKYTAILDFEQILFNKTGIEPGGEILNTSKDEHQEVISAVQGFYARKDCAHNLEHALRVRDWGRKIAQAEKAELRVVELAAILHDIGRPGTLEKTHAESSAALGKNVLQKLGYSEDLIQRVIEAVVSHSREGGYEPLSLEAKVLYDADKLDFVGPIGIARLFTWGGKEGKPLFGPNSCEEFYRERIRNYPNHLFTESAKSYFKPLFEYCEDFWNQLSKLKA